MFDFIYGIYGIHRFQPFFDKDAGAGGGADNPADNPNPDDSDAGADDPKPEKTFTQAELDELITKRLERERKKYEGFDELKTKLTEYEQAEEERRKAAMSEQERLEAEKAEALKKAEEAENASAEVLRKANERLINAEFRLLAKEAGIRSDALDDAFKLADISGVEVGDDGAVNGVDDVIKALTESKPYLVEQAKPKPRQIGEGSDPGGGKADKTSEQLLHEAAEKARATGKPEDKMAYAKLKRELS